MYIQKESVRRILIDIKFCFLISKNFIMNMDKFLNMIALNTYCISLILDPLKLNYVHKYRLSNTPTTT